MSAAAGAAAGSRKRRSMEGVAAGAAVVDAVAALASAAAPAAGAPAQKRGASLPRRARASNHRASAGVDAMSVPISTCPHRRLHVTLNGRATHTRLSADAAHAARARRPAAVVELDDETGAMSVEAYLKHVLDKLTDKAREYTDDAIDELAATYKQHREEIRNMQHQKKAEQAAKNKAGASVPDRGRQGAVPCGRTAQPVAGDRPAGRRWSVAQRRGWDHRDPPRPHLPRPQGRRRSSTSC